MALFILFALFIFLLAVGVPVAFSMGISALMAIISLGENIPLIIIPQRLYSSINSFPLMAVPFFILAGFAMNAGGLTKRLVNLSTALIGHIAGGLAQVNVLVSMFFAGISGSASADASAIGSMLIPAMIEDGYEPSFTVSVTAASACIGPIIPPSIVMVIYGSITNVSIGALFAGGIVPGILIGTAQMFLVSYYAKKRGYHKLSKRIHFAKVFITFKEAVWGLIAPIIILGGILSGFFTPTEAGAVAAVYSLFVGVFIYKEIKLSNLKELFIESAILTAIPMLIVAMASNFGWVMARQQLSNFLINTILSITSNPYLMLLIIVGMITLITTVIEATAAIIIFVPLLIPVSTRFGWDPIHFGLVVLCTMLIGTITPPVGLQLYIASAIAKIPISKVKEIWLFVLVMLFVVVLMVFFPIIVTFIPNLFFKKY